MHELLTVTAAASLQTQLITAGFTGPVSAANAGAAGSEGGPWQGMALGVSAGNDFGAGSKMLEGDPDLWHLSHASALRALTTHFITARSG